MIKENKPYSFTGRTSQGQIEASAKALWQKIGEEKKPLKTVRSIMAKKE